MIHRQPSEWLQGRKQAFAFKKWQMWSLLTIWFWAKRRPSGCQRA
jgi:hypothetical protein